MRLVFFVVAVIFCEVSSASADAGTCLQERWSSVINRQLPIGEAFAIHYIAARTIGPNYKMLDSQQQQEARNATQYALQEAFTAHIGTLRRMVLSISHTPIERARSYEIEGEFIHPNGERYRTQAWVSKKGCKILAMVVERSFLIDWLKETERMSVFLRSLQ